MSTADCDDTREQRKIILEMAYRTHKCWCKSLQHSSGQASTLWREPSHRSHLCSCLRLTVMFSTLQTQVQLQATWGNVHNGLLFSQVVCHAEKNHHRAPLQRRSPWPTVSQATAGWMSWPAQDSRGEAIHLGHSNCSARMPHGLGCSLAGLALELSFICQKLVCLTRTTFQSTFFTDTTTGQMRLCLGVFHAEIPI